MHYDIIVVIIIIIIISSSSSSSINIINNNIKNSCLFSFFVETVKQLNASVHKKMYFLINK